MTPENEPEPLPAPGSQPGAQAAMRDGVILMECPKCDTVLTFRRPPDKGRMRSELRCPVCGKVAFIIWPAHDDYGRPKGSRANGTVSTEAPDS